MMSLFARLSAVSRRRKLELFYETMQPAPRMRVLDLGAEIESDTGDCLQFIDKYPWKDKITAANIDPDPVRLIAQRHPEVEAVVADALKLPWPDTYFDIVYSNAVIEHVGQLEDQKQMASEIMRVGKQWFVTTPNRWYPFEFHLRLPFVTWLPGQAYLKVGRVVRYSHVRRRYVMGMHCSGIRLMTAAELMACFPGGRVIKQRVTFMAETLIAVGGVQAAIEPSPGAAEDNSRLATRP
jgi:SAM-dependent methyltransferase